MNDANYDFTMYEHLIHIHRFLGGLAICIDWLKQNEDLRWIRRAWFSAVVGAGVVENFVSM